MKKSLILGACALALLLLPSAGLGSGAPRRVLSFNTMYAVDGPFLGSENAINGVEGDDLPWVIASAKGSLTSKGRLKIDVKGLVFSDDPKVPPALQGINDEKEFRGLVSCLTETEDEEVVLVNVMTEGFPASIDGDSKIDAQIELPDPCIAPVVFVLAGSEVKWFAVTGVEVEED